MKNISIKIDKKAEDFLTRIAKQNGFLSPKDGSVVFGKTVKEILKWCELNAVDIGENHSVFDDETKKMIEQFHVSIPHILYLSRFNLTEKMSEKKSPRFF